VGLAPQLKQRAQAHARRLFDPAVELDEGPAPRRGQRTAEAALARAAKSDQGDLLAAARA
jgi:hypothetical protein